MKITVRIHDIEVIVDRPNFGDATGNYTEQVNIDTRKSVMETTIIPLLEETTKKAKELYELRNQNI